MKMVPSDRSKHGAEVEKQGFNCSDELMADQLGTSIKRQKGREQCHNKSSEPIGPISGFLARAVIGKPG
jgi:hypothetical protein